MPLVPFDSLPDDARVWVFASDRPVTGAQAERLLAEVDGFLSRWSAHGAPLTCARDWREDHFLVIGVDQRSAGASGCSIDGLFRQLKGLESVLGASLVRGGRILYRDSSGGVRSVSRDEFGDLGARGDVSRDTLVFDPTLTTKGDLDTKFEGAASDGWQGELLKSDS